MRIEEEKETNVELEQNRKRKQRKNENRRGKGNEGRRRRGKRKRRQKENRKKETKVEGEQEREKERVWGENPKNCIWGKYIYLYKVRFGEGWKREGGGGGIDPSWTRNFISVSSRPPDHPVLIVRGILTPTIIVSIQILQPLDTQLYFVILLLLGKFIYTLHIDHTESVHIICTETAGPRT